MLSKGLSCAAADDGARLMLISASLVCFLQKVYSKCTLLLSSCESKPPSNSVERSGLRSALPGWFAMRLGVSVPDVTVEDFVGMLTVPAVYVTSAAVDPGWTPLAPNAERSRN